MAELVDPRKVERFLVIAIGTVIVAVVAFVVLIPGRGHAWVAQVVSKGDTFVCVEARNGGGPADGQRACFDREDEAVEVPWHELYRGACVGMIDRRDGGLAIEDVGDDYGPCDRPSP